MGASRTKDFGVSEGTSEFPSIQQATGAKHLKKLSRFQQQEVAMRSSLEEPSLPACDTRGSRKYKPPGLSESNIERGLSKYRNAPSLKQNCIKFASHESDYTAFLHSNGLLNANSFQPAYGRKEVRGKAGSKGSTALNSARGKLGGGTTS